MAKVIPFRAVQYNGTCASNLETLITPPYDVISPREQDAFYRSHPRNMIRLVLGKEYPDDSEVNNRYSRAAVTLKSWLDAGIMVRRERPSMTVYQMEFELPDGGRRLIDGIVALVKVDAYGKGKVLPHEKTYKGPKQDQLNLLRSCRAHFTPIHALFPDEHQKVVSIYERFIRQHPDLEARDPNGAIHRTWTFDDEQAIAGIQAVLDATSLFIADGHHRYETSLAYRDEILASGNSVPSKGHEYVMMYLTAMSHPGLTILPAHRLVKSVGDFYVEGVLAKLDPYFHVKKFDYTDRDSAVQIVNEQVRPYAQAGGMFAMAVAKESAIWTARLKSHDAVDSLIDESIPPALREFDVTVLREAIMGHGLGLDRDDLEGKIEYSPSIADSIERLDNGRIQIAFLMNPTRVEQVQTAAELGHKLPHKSTYFFPKIASGLVLNVM